MTRMAMRAQARKSTLTDSEEYAVIVATSALSIHSRLVEIPSSEILGEKMEVANDNEALLLGANAIAAYLQITRRQAYRLIYDEDLPTFKLGGTVAARKSSLSKWLEAAEQGRVAA